MIVPTHNLVVHTQTREEAKELGEIVKKHYPDYKKGCGFNADKPHYYYVTHGEKYWNNTVDRKAPDWTQYTLEEFKGLIIPEVINNYSIY